MGLSAAADVFVGMVEAPLLVRPYLGALSRGELFSVMSCGMATIAGTVMVPYASILGEVLPDAMGHEDSEHRRNARSRAQQVFSQA